MDWHEASGRQRHGDDGSRGGSAVQLYRHLAAVVVVSMLARPAVALAAVTDPAPTGRGVLADLATDARTGLILVKRQLGQPLTGAGIAPMVICLVLTVALTWPARRWLIQRLTFLLRRSQGSEFAIFARAILTVVVTVSCIVVGGLAFVGGLNSSLRLLPEAAALINVTFVSVVLSGVGLGIGTAFRSPDDKSMRPVALPPGLGSAVSSYAFAAGLMLGLAAFIDTASKTLRASSTSWTAAQLVLALIEIAMIARFLIAAGRARERQAAANVGGLQAFGAATVAWAVLAVACGALVFGALRFSMNLLQNMLWAALVLALAWLITRFLDALVRKFLASEKRAARFAIGIVGVRQTRVEQAALLISAALGTFVWLVAVGMVLVPVFGDGDNVVDQVRPGPIMESIRALRLSPRSLMIALFLLVGGIVVTRMTRRWFEQRFLPSTNLGVGARTSIVTGLSYIGTIIALVAASGALGLQLDKITLIASALTVGVGFGLQAIIQNFVSGVILLFERPIQLGDRVVVSGSEGRVHRMRVRATELEADDGSIAIIPNSAFISSTVINKGDSPKETSIELEATVSGTDSANKARDLLVAMLKDSDAVNPEIEPQIHLRALRGSLWKFNVRFHPRRSEARGKVVSDLLFHIGAAQPDGVRIMVG